MRIVDGPGRNPDAWVAFNIGGNPAITEGNTVYVRHDNYRRDFSATPAGINTLVHEFAHVRQFQQMGFGGFFAKYASDIATYRDRDAVYRYETRTSHFRNEPIEGQAEMIGDYAGYRAGQPMAPERVRDLEQRLRGTGLFGLQRYALVMRSCALIIVLVGLSGCQLDAEMTVSGPQNKPVFAVTSEGKPACIQSISLSTEADPMRPIWAVVQKYRAKQDTCRSSITLGESPPDGYETSVVLSQPIGAGEYRAEASGVGWNADKRVTITD